MTKDSF